MNFGFVKAVCAAPKLRVADCTYNAAQIAGEIKNAAAKGTELLCLPELCLTGYTCGDLFFQPVLQQGALNALQTVADATKGSDMLVLAGLPLVVGGKLYNCAAVLQNGRVLGAVPKTHLPNYGEFYEMRQFTPAPAENEEITLLGQRVLFGTKQLFCCAQNSDFVLGVDAYGRVRKF